MYLALYGTIKQTTQVILLGALAAAALGYFRIRPLMLKKNSQKSSKRNIERQ